MAGDLRQILDLRLALFLAEGLMPRGAERSMYDQIGVPANGGCEMRVARCRETEVSQILGCVPRFLHRAEHEKRDRLLLGLALDTLDQLLKVARAERRQRRSQ